METLEVVFQEAQLRTDFVMMSLLMALLICSLILQSEKILGLYTLVSMSSSCSIEIMINKIKLATRTKP